MRVYFKRFFEIMAHPDTFFDHVPEERDWRTAAGVVRRGSVRLPALLCHSTRRPGTTIGRAGDRQDRFHLHYERVK